MCGIAGILSLRSAAPRVEVLRAMMRAIQHRGPDDQGVYHDDTIALGHLRLAILDLSAAGHQPMANARGDLQIVFNGEIYNYLELRSELKDLGFEFVTGTDTEVLLAAYEAWGTECLSRLNGMWAFAIWDARRQALFCSRDRFGIKPFYYWHGPGQFCFGSELKALLAVPDLPRRISDQAVYLYLQHRLTNVGDGSFVTDIRQLPAAHYLWLEAGEARLVPYWTLRETAAPAGLAGQTARVRELFLDSVRLQLRSDVPVGTCLSGGIDSSAIVCAIQALLECEATPDFPLQTFSACFHDPALDERPYIRAVLARTQAQGHEVFPDEEDITASLDALIHHQDEPFTGLSMYAQWCVMRQARTAGIKVLLDGQGADEILAGYHYQGYLWAELWRRRQWPALGREMLAALPHGAYASLYRMRKVLASGRPDADAFDPHWNPEFMARFSPAELIQVRARFGSLFKQQLVYALEVTLGQLLRSEDRNSMAFSIEARVPFLDHRLVELLFALPDQSLIHRHWSKWIFRRAMQGILPPAIQWRRSKIGFEVPQETWLKRELRPLIQDLFSDRCFRERPFWDGPRIAADYARWLKGEPVLQAQQIWQIVNLELWIRRSLAQPSV
ncbi:MAG: asparagine synthase (glutamine-hydrolyzing) [Candidatus Sericytochromatia bacterium]